MFIFREYYFERLPNYSFALYAHIFHFDSESDPMTLDLCVLIVIFSWDSGLALSIHLFLKSGQEPLFRHDSMVHFGSMKSLPPGPSPRKKKKKDYF